MTRPDSDRVSDDLVKGAPPDGVLAECRGRISGIERVLRRVATSALVAVAFMLLAAIWVRPGVTTNALGDLYVRMARDPFAPLDGNFVAYRILTPLISYLIGLRGELLIVTNLIVAAVLLALVYLRFRREFPDPLDAVTAVATIAWSMVTFYTIYNGGYCDALTYLLLFLMWWHRARWRWFFPLFLANALNRECVLFLVPWFCVLQYRESSDRARTVLRWIGGYGSVLVLLILWHRWVDRRMEGAFDLDFYLGPLRGDPFHWIKRSYPEAWVGFFSVFKMTWSIPFVAAAAMWRHGDRGKVLEITVLMLCTGAQLIVAFDSSRVFALGYLVMLDSLIYLFRGGHFEIRRWAPWLILGNLLVPNLYTAGHSLVIMQSLPGVLVERYVLGHDAW